MGEEVEKSGKNHPEEVAGNPMVTAMEGAEVMVMEIEMAMETKMEADLPDIIIKLQHV